MLTNWLSHTGRREWGTGCTLAKRKSCVPRCSQSPMILKPIKKWLSPCTRSWLGKKNSLDYLCSHFCVFYMLRNNVHLLFIVVCSYTHDIEALSCDEVLIDASALLTELSINPEELSEAIRADIKERTGCCASVGMGELYLSFTAKYIETVFPFNNLNSLLIF